MIALSLTGKRYDYESSLSYTADGLSPGEIGFGSMRRKLGFGLTDREGSGRHLYANRVSEPHSTYLRERVSFSNMMIPNLEVEIRENTKADTSGSDVPVCNRRHSQSPG